VIVRRLWKLSRPSEQRLHWSNSATRRWMISLPGMRWGCTGSLYLTCWSTKNWDRRRAHKGRLCCKFVGPEPALGVSRLDIRRRIRRWLVNQHWVWWRDLGYTQRQARELISGPCLRAKARFLSCNRTQSRAVTGLLTGHNTLRRHLHLIWLPDSSLCRRCGAEDETSAHILCECEALASLRRVTGLLLGARGH